MIRGIIFDCFGVLYVDWSKAYFDRFPVVRQELHKLDTQADYGLVGKEDYLKRAAQIMQLSVDEVAMGIRHEARLNEPMIEYVKSLKRHYKIALLSNIGRGWIDDFFTEHQLHDMFDTVVLSNEEGIAKPNPVIFKRVAARLDLAPQECLMIDDREENCRGAEEAGMQSIQFRTNEQLAEALEQIIVVEKEEA